MEVADIAVIGSGAAATTTLMEVLGQLIEGPSHQKKLNITVVEKYGEFWKGVPYGSRSSVNSLTITAISDFISSGKEKELFFSWLKTTRCCWPTQYRESGGMAAQVWLDKNLPLIENEEWDAVYLPRFIFGIYMHNKMLSLLNRAQDKGLVQVITIQAEAINVKLNADNQYQVTLELPDKTAGQVIAAKLVIATGSAPVKNNVSLEDEGRNYVYINELYEPSLDSNLALLKNKFLNTAEIHERNLLIIGSNASSIELLYLLNHRPDILENINKIVTISQTGIMPYHISDTRFDEYPCPNLDKAKAEGGYDIHTLLAATKKDMAPAVKQGVIIPYVDKVVSYTLELMQPLGEDAKRIFFGVYGPQITRLIRRSGPAYKGSANALIGKNKLELLKGKFLNIGEGVDSGILHYSTEGHVINYPEPFKVIINCSGSDDLQQSSSRLISSLVKQGLCKINLSGKGFLVNESFEAAPNLYVMGPLLGGNMNSRIHFWHLENVARLLYLSPYLAEHLLDV